MQARLRENEYDDAVDAATDSDPELIPKLTRPVYRSRKRNDDSVIDLTVDSDSDHDLIWPDEDQNEVSQGRASAIPFGPLCFTTGYRPSPEIS